MPAESNITNLFRSADAPTPSIDVQSVIRRSRRRRLPKQVAAGSVFSLAILGVGFVGVNGVGAVSGTSDQAAVLESAGGAAEDESAFSGPVEDGAKLAPAEKLNLCGGEVAEVAPSSTGLELTVDFPDAAVGAETVEGTVTLTNNGTGRTVGYTAPLPVITLSQNGIVVWHSNGPMIMSVTDVDLAPGESMEYEAFFTPVVCSVEDDLGQGFRDNLPAAPAGEYQVSAAIDLVGDAPTELITGPADTITLK